MLEIFIHQIAASSGIHDLLLVVTGALITLVGTLGATIYVKNREIKSIALVNAQQISLLLMLERTSLKKVDDFIQTTIATKTPRKVFMTGLYLKVEQESLIKILQYKKFHEDKFIHKYAEILQRLVAAEQVYRDCYHLAELYNHNVQSMLEAKAENPEPTERIKGYGIELESIFSNIVTKYSDAVKINEKVKIDFDALCMEVFIRWKWCRASTYLPVVGTNDFSKAVDL